MTNNPENQYEDSYQKRERLESELESAVNEAENFYILSSKDLDNIHASPKESEMTTKRLDELGKQQAELEAELKRQQVERDNFNKSETDIDKKIDYSFAMSEEIYATLKKILSIGDEIDVLFKKSSEIFKEESGRWGDFEGTAAILKMKMEKVEEIKKQLDELGD